MRLSRTAVIAAATGLLSGLSVAGTALAQTSSDDAAATAAASLGMMGIVFWCCYGLLILFSIFLAIFYLFMMYDAAMRDKADYPNDNKSMWIILLLLLQGWAALFYFFMVKRKGNAATRAVTPPPPPAV